jgi:PhnB protein
MPENLNYKISENDKDKVMHVSLPISDGNVLMGCDSTQALCDSNLVGNNFSISINTDSINETKRLFAHLSKDGVVKMPLEKTFWGSYFAMFTDKFGIHWMVNCGVNDEK